MTLREERGLGLPWSEVLVERGRRSVGGTRRGGAAGAASTAIGMNLGGGTHHAGRDFARGYCLFNDVVVTWRSCARKGWSGGRWSSTATSTRATAPPSCSAPILTPSRSRCTARATTRSSGSRPTSTSTWRSGTGDDEYLRALDEALDTALPRAEADIAFFLAGADPWEGDRLGRLALTKAGLRARDELVLDRLLATGAAVVVVLAGGYAPDVRDTVDINAATVAAVAARDGALS